VLGALVPGGTPVVGRIGVDGTVLVFLLAVTTVTAVASMFAPAIRFSRPALVGRLDTRGARASRGHLRQLFIATEVTLSVVLLVGASLLLYSLRELQRAQGGFSADHVTIMRMRGMGGGGAPMMEGYSRYLAQIAQVDGIEAAGVTSGVLPGRPGSAFTIAGEAPATATTARQQASYQIVSAGYFPTLGIPLEAGRLFTEEDAPGRPAVAIVNREMARQFWADGNPIGRQIRAGEGPRAATMTIVGIVGNVRPPFQTGDVPQIYVSYRQQSEPNIALIVRTRPGSPAPIAALKQAIWSVEPKQAVFGIVTMEEALSGATTNQRAITVLIGGFAALALAMSVSGIYTVITYLVSRRVKEIAVRRRHRRDQPRRAVVAGRPHADVDRRGLDRRRRGAIAASRGLRAAVVGVLPLNATLLTSISAAYLAVVVLAIAVAARGALRIDPAAALRAE
jgi:hypothetical protein